MLKKHSFVQERDLDAKKQFSTQTEWLADLTLIALVITLPLLAISDFLEGFSVLEIPYVDALSKVYLTRNEHGLLCLQCLI